MSDKQAFIDDHASYPDVFPEGLQNYPFAKARIEPVIFEVPDGCRVLDVGCNSGEFLKYLKEKKGCEVYGVDISAGMIDLCKTKGLENVQVVDADTLPFPDAHFDVVTLMEVLMFFNEPVTYLKEIRRVLKPTGYLLGTVPHKNLETFLWDDKRKHQRYYTEESLRKDLNEVFDVSKLWVLKGGQFSVGLADSLLATEPTEMLFKSGGPQTEAWDEQMRKSKALKVYMGFTQLAGDVYFRMRGFADKMREAGHEIAYEDFNYDGSESQNKWQTRIKSRLIQNTLEHLVRVADVSVWQLVGNRMCLAFLQCARDLVKKPIVTELDDWIWDLPSYNIAAHPYQPNSEPEWVCTEQLKASSAFVVSTNFIKERLQEMFPDKPVYLVPNALDFAIWDNLKAVEIEPKFKKQEGRIRIGYTGCGNHDGDMEIVKRPILKLLEEFPNVEFLTSHPFPSWNDVTHDRFINLNRWVQIDRFPHEMAGWGLDIGIAPLRDNTFNRAKSNLRWLEFGAMHIPTVMSRVRPFKECVTEGVDGLLCSSELEWYQSLKGLILDAEKRKALGETAYTKVKRDYNMDVIAKDYARILEEIKRSCNDQTLKTKSDGCLETKTISDGRPTSLTTA
jgi:ubiquinone/menaquinone biosynthesis C-methylase UbiE/glycosyltransferase involved in cell wall biosynthesis